MQCSQAIWVYKGGLIKNKLIPSRGSVRLDIGLELKLGQTRLGARGYDATYVPPVASNQFYSAREERNKEIKKTITPQGVLRCLRRLYEAGKYVRTCQQPMADGTGPS